MRPIYASDATRLEVDGYPNDRTVEVAHTLRDDSGTVTTYYVPLDIDDAKHLAKQLDKAIRKATTNQTREA